MGNNSAFLKQHNRTIILDTIARNMRIPRADIARITGLSKGGITPIISELLELGLIIETGTAESRGGKRPILLTLNPSGCFSIVADWTRNDCSVATVNMLGGIGAVKKIDVTAADSPATIINFIKNAVRSLTKGKRRLTGMCIVAPGPVDRTQGVILNPPNFHGWSDIEVVSRLKRSFDFPVFLENNANAHGMAEKYIGKGRDYRDFIHIIVDEGIGASIFMDGRLHLGGDGFGSELGHVSIDFNGPLCGCGNTGCLELYASLPAIMRTLNEVIEIGAASPFFESVFPKRRLQWNDFIDGMAAGDPICLNLMRKEAEYLGCAVVTAVNLFEPEAIVIGSKIAVAGDYLLKPLTEYIGGKLFTRGFRTVAVHMSSVKNASLSGGGFLMSDRFINGELGSYETVLGLK